MEVLSSNFEAEFPGLVEAIKTADFVSTDCEFTGLGRGSAAVGPYDTPELVYSKFKQNVGNFLTIQVGICTFRFVPESNSFVYKAYSCYVLPRVPSEFQGMFKVASCIRPIYSLQADALALLGSFNFDFNKWVKEAVGYMKQPDMDEIVSELNRMREHHDDCMAAPEQPRIPDNMKPLINKKLYQIEAYLKTAETDQKPLELTGLNGYERKLVYQAVEYKYRTKVYMETKKDESSANVHKKILCVVAATDYAERRQRRYDEKIEILEKAKGFTRLFDVLLKSGKPVVGHNMFMDLLHLFKAFCKDLPVTWSEFKRICNDNFLPHVLDTKLICSQLPFKNLLGSNPSLVDLHEKISKEPFKTIQIDAADAKYGYGSRENYHDAGYDAFATGRVLIHLVNHWANSKTEGRKSFGIPWDFLQSLRNKVSVPRVQDMPFMDADPKHDNMPDRSHVFHLRLLDDSLKSKDIVALFSPYGPVNISWEDPTAVWVALQRKQEAILARKAICQPVEEADISSDKAEGSDDDNRKNATKKWRAYAAVDYLKRQEEMNLKKRCRNGEKAEKVAKKKKDNAV